MNGRGRRGLVRDHVASLGLALWLFMAISASLAFSPHMQHADGCPMPQHSRGQPCVLNLPAVPPPLTLGPGFDNDLVMVLSLGGIETPDAPDAVAPQARGPPFVHARS